MGDFAKVRAYRRTTGKVKEHVRRVKGTAAPNKKKGGSGGGSSSDYNQAANNSASGITNKDHQDAIRKYSGREYLNINRCKRKKINCKHTNPKTVTDLEAALESSPKYNGTTHRGIQFSDQAKMNDFMSGVKKGGVFTDKGFTSTSASKDEADLFGTGTFQVMFKIKSKRGTAIKSFSDIPTEEEVLFNSNTSFAIKSVKKKGNNVTIELIDP